MCFLCGFPPPSPRVTLKEWSFLFGVVSSLGGLAGRGAFRERAGGRALFSSRSPLLGTVFLRQRRQLFPRWSPFWHTRPLGEDRLFLSPPTSYFHFSTGGKVRRFPFLRKWFTSFLRMNEAWFPRLDDDFEPASYSFSHDPSQSILSL